MRLSQTFVKTLKSYAGEGEAVNHRLLVQAGFIRQEAAGIYSYLPLGLRVLRNIEQIIRTKMNDLGAEEILMPILHPAAPWKTTGGWDSIAVLYKLKSRTGHEYALGQSEEEIVTPLVLSQTTSYRDFPVLTYQIHWKYRDELRAKSGIMRGREFYMKDLYSFHTTQADFDRFYAIAKQAYLEIYNELGLTAKVTEASGGEFSEKVSFEFEVLTEAGEDTIYYCPNCDFCVNDEIATVKSGDACPRCEKGKLQEAKASEVGNVFDLGQKYGKAFGLAFTDKDNQQQYPVIGCYGLGISRVMGVIAEKHHDDNGLIWPACVAPADVQLVRVGDDPKVKKAADKLYDVLTKAGKAVIYDDRDERPGAKFADADLMGMPQRLVVSSKTLVHDSAELKSRISDESELVKLGEVSQHI